MKYILEIDDAKEGANGAVIEVIFDGDGSYGSVSLPKNRLTPYLADAVYQEGASHGERLGRQEAPAYMIQNTSSRQVSTSTL